MPEKTTHTLTFAYEREHKHSCRYEEVDINGKPVKEPILGKIYYARRGFAKGPFGKHPERIRITIEEL